jgi:predicted DCC family thiol-disulfide oxidoreductase YuxK
VLLSSSAFLAALRARRRVSLVVWTTPQRSRDVAYEQPASHGWREAGCRADHAQRGL